jgi:hypothetical protein
MITEPRMVRAPAWLYDGMRAGENRSTLFKAKEDRNFNERNILGISRTMRRFTVC